MKPQQSPRQKAAVAVGEPKGAVPVPQRRQLPESYGTKRLFLLARDPRSLCAQWDFSGAEQGALHKLSADGDLSLRIFKDSPDGRRITQVKIHPETRQRFVPVSHSGTRYVAELGYNPKSGGWVSVALSKPVLTPPDALAPDMAERMTTIPPGMPFQEVPQGLRSMPAKPSPPVAPVEPGRRPVNTPVQNPPSKKASLLPAAQPRTPPQPRRLAETAASQRALKLMADQLTALNSQGLCGTPGCGDPSPTPQSCLMSGGLLDHSAPTSPDGDWANFRWDDFAGETRV